MMKKPLPNLQPSSTPKSGSMQADLMRCKTLAEMLQVVGQYYDLDTRLGMIEKGKACVGVPKIVTELKLTRKS